MSLRSTFIETLEVWPEAAPHVGLMATRRQMQLIVAMGGRELSPRQVARRMGLTPAAAERLLEGAARRHLLTRERGPRVVRYSQVAFTSVLDHFVKFGRWSEVPQDDQKQIDRRFLESFVEQHRPNVERKRKGRASQGHLPNDAVLLLSEAEEMIEASDAIAVHPCGCRLLGGRCTRPVEACILLDGVAEHALSQGEGRQLSRLEGIELLRLCDRKGLMHTADPDWRQNGLLYICNCCGCDCYPFRAARELDSKPVWPAVRYLAEVDPMLCKHCGKCLRRCHFDAFERSAQKVRIKSKQRKRIEFDAERCWGCGLCANTCPEQAISMLRL